LVKKPEIINTNINITKTEVTTVVGLINEARALIPIKNSYKKRKNKRSATFLNFAKNANIADNIKIVSIEEPGFFHYTLLELLFQVFNNFLGFL
jgi:hypothetical protein